jgi:hypothetical protein
MPPRGSWPGLMSARASSGAQAKTPELPPDFRCRHSTTSSKFFTFFAVRITPTGVPLQWISSLSSWNVQVSGSSLTWAKSASFNGRQPGPSPTRSSPGARAGPSAAARAGTDINARRHASRFMGRGLSGGVQGLQA